MSKPNIINQILRDNELKYSLESLQEEEERTNAELAEVDLISSSIAELVRIQCQVEAAQGICREQAVALESIDGFRLPFPSAGFTVQPSQTGLRLTQESIGKAIADGGKYLYERLLALLRSIGKLLMGSDAKIQRGKESVKRARETLALAKPGVSKETVDLSRLLKPVVGAIVLSMHGTEFKGIAADMVYAAKSLESIGRSEFDLTDHFKSLKSILNLNNDALREPNKVVFELKKHLASKAFDLSAKYMHDESKAVQLARADLERYGDATNSIIEIVGKAIANANKSLDAAAKHLKVMRLKSMDDSGGVANAAKDYMAACVLVRGLAGVLLQYVTINPDMSGGQDAN